MFQKIVFWVKNELSKSFGKFVRSFKKKDSFSFLITICRLIVNCSFFSKRHHVYEQFSSFTKLCPSLLTCVGHDDIIFLNLTIISLSSSSSMLVISLLLSSVLILCWQYKFCVATWILETNSFPFWSMLWISLEPLVSASRTKFSSSSSPFNHFSKFLFILRGIGA